MLPFTIYLVHRRRPLSIVMQEGYATRGKDVAIAPYLVSFPSSRFSAWFFLAGSTSGIVSVYLITGEVDV